MKKTIKLTGVVFSILLLLTIPSFAQENSLHISVNNDNCMVGDEIILSIMGDELWDIAGVDIEIIYDSTMLELVEKEIPVLNSIDIQEYKGDNPDLEDSHGAVKILFGLTEGTDLLDNQQILANISFKALDTGETTVSIDENSQLIQETHTEENYKYTNPQPAQSLEITISKLGKIWGNINLSDAYTEEDITINLIKDGSLESSFNVDETGAYEFLGLEDGEYSLEVDLLGYEKATHDVNITDGEDIELNITLVRIKSDANRDGEVDLEDLVFVARRYGMDNENPSWNVDADINGDNTVDTLDLINITRNITNSK